MGQRQECRGAEVLLLIPYHVPGQQERSSGGDLLGKGYLGETISTRAGNVLVQDVRHQRSIFPELWFLF